MTKSPQKIHITALEKAMLPWYDKHQRTLPWRASFPKIPNPYHVWLSEVMLQQTMVATVIDYFIRFVTRWPTLQSLARANLDEVFHAWQGLGYYSRARNLHRCAQMVMETFSGKFPDTKDALLTLPGIGPYTAAAIAAIAYDKPVVPVDGNVVRVFSRVFALETPLPAVKDDVQILASTMIPTHRSGDFAQSLMDVGATICRPKKPMCTICPLQKICQGQKQNRAELLPVPALKKTKPHRYGIVFWLENEDNQILLEKRPDKGLLAGLIGLPTTLWQDDPWDPDAKDEWSPTPHGIKTWELLPTSIRHTFTHFHLDLKIAKAKAQNHTRKGELWSSISNLGSYAFPTIMKKVIRETLKFSSEGTSHQAHLFKIAQPDFSRRKSNHKCPAENLRF